MRRATMAVVLLLGLAVGGHATAAAVLEGVRLPDTRLVGGEAVTLNGVGLRTATILNLKVYVMALYLERPSHSPVEIIESDQTARIELHMLRDVGARDMRRSWSRGFRDNYRGDVDLTPQIDALINATTDLKDRDVLAFDLAGPTVTCSLNGATTTIIEGSEFRRGLLSVWLGDKPPTKARHTRTR